RRKQLAHEHVTHEAKAFTLLSPDEQWDLYGYFKPHHHLTEAELKDHHVAIAKQDPSLPQRAGRAFKKLEPILNLPDDERSQSAAVQHNLLGGSPIGPLVRSEIDHKKIASGLIGLARAQLRL